MRKGHYLEIELNKIINYLNNNGVHAHKNHAKRTQDGVYLEGEPFDYEVISNGKTFCFDAKECHANKWNLKTNAKLSQVKNLLDAADNGAEAFFLVWFAEQNKIVKFDIHYVQEAMAKGTSSLKAEDGEGFEWRIFLK